MGVVLAWPVLAGRNHTHQTAPETTFWPASTGAEGRVWGRLLIHLDLAWPFPGSSLALEISSFGSHVSWCSMAGGFPLAMSLVPPADFCGTWNWSWSCSAVHQCSCPVAA